MDWTTVKKFTIGGTYDAEVEYLESNGTQAMVIPGASTTVDLQMTSSASQTVFSRRINTTFYKFGINANGEYAFNGDSFGVPATNRVTVELKIIASSSARRYGASATIGDVVKSGQMTARGPSQTNSLFATVDASGVATEKASMRLYSASGYKLVRVGNAGALFNLSNNTLIFPTEGTLACGPDTLVTKEVVKISTSDFPLVPGAKRIEYIQGNLTTNWIDTGVVASGSIDFEIKFVLDPTPLAGANASITGVTNTSASNKGAVGFSVDPIMSRFMARAGTSRIMASYFSGFVANTPQTIKMSQMDAAFYIDGVSHAWIKRNVPNLVYPFLIGMSSSDGVPYTSGASAPIKIYHVKIWSNDGTTKTLLRDFVPIKIGTEGCLYDNVNGVVYHNAGTEPYVCGPEVVETVLWKKPVPYDSEVEYLESTGTQYIETGLYLQSSDTVSMRADATSSVNEALWSATERRSWTSTLSEWEQPGTSSTASLGRSLETRGQAPSGMALTCQKFKTLKAQEKTNSCQIINSKSLAS